MSAHSTGKKDGKVIPPGVVFMTVGLIILLTVAATWFIIPSKMPQPLYAIVKPYLLETAGRATVTEAIPTVAVMAAVETPTVTTPLLPETAPAEEDSEYPPGFVSAADAATQELLPGRPVRIVIPQINLDAPVGEIGLEPVVSDGQTYYQWQVPDGFKAGWHYNSALLGQPGNTVLNGHHNINGEVFRDLIDLEEGDEIIMFDEQRTFTYQITDKLLLAERGQPISTRLENAQWIKPTEDERITLITCWPYTDNSHRLIIVARPVAVSEQR